MRLISAVLFGASIAVLAGCAPPSQPPARVMMVTGTAVAARSTAAPPVRRLAAPAVEEGETEQFASALGPAEAPPDLGGMPNGVAAPPPPAPP